MNKSKITLWIWSIAYPVYNCSNLYSSAYGIIHFHTGA